MTRRKGWFDSYVYVLATTLSLLLLVIAGEVALVATGHAAGGAEASGPLSLLALILGAAVDFMRLSARARKAKR